MVDFIIIAVVVACVVFSIAHIRKKKKAGESGCGCSCDGCGTTSCSDKH